MNNLWYDWMEAEEPVAVQSPTTDPNAIMGGQPLGNQGPPPQQPQNDVEDDVEDDPVAPDQPEEEPPKDFEQWRHDFLELAVKGDVEEMIDFIGYAKSFENLESPQKKFIDDNLQILLYRQDANVAKASKEIRNLIKQDLDRTNPGTTVMQHLTATVEKDQVLQHIPIKLSGLGGLKGDLHRKYMGGLLGAVQVGGGGSRPDLMYVEKDYTINFSTRFHTQFGEVTLGKWTLKADDPDRYLTEPEMDRLQNGSPEEKQVLRRRVIIESIGEKFKERAFLIQIAETDGTIFNLGWDLGDSLLAAYKDGKVVVRGKRNEEKDAMISDSGEIVTLIDLDILFVKESGETDDEGRPEMTEIPFMERRDSTLYLTADMETLQTASTVLSGMFFHEMPYNGNPAEVPSIAACVPSVSELLNRRCQQ